jgi:hypothetical protein
VFLLVAGHQRQSVATRDQSKHKKIGKKPVIIYSLQRNNKFKFQAMEKTTDLKSANK